MLAVVQISLELNIPSHSASQIKENGHLTLESVSQSTKAPSQHPKDVVKFLHFLKGNTRTPREERYYDCKHRSDPKTTQ